MLRTSFSFSKPSAALRIGALAVAVGAAACAEDDAPLNQMVVSFETDMSVPESIDTLAITVSRNGENLLRKSYTLGAQGEAHLPATLTIASEGPPHVPVTVSVAGSKQGHFRTYREITTVLPQTRVGLLRMPVQWLCDGSAIADGSGDSALVRSTCDKGFTCRAGDCVPNLIDDSDLLPTFASASVFGGTEEAALGACFDTVACMQTGYVVQPDNACTIPRPDGADFNIALRVVTDGICDGTRSMCFVPLDGNSTEGYVANDEPRVQLPTSVCTKLEQGSVRAVYVSPACKMKTAATPPCGSWSSVSAENAILPPSDQQPATPPTATLIASLPVISPEGAKRTVCCPLLSGTDTLYSCLCDGQSTTDSQLYAVSTSQPSGGAQLVQSMHASMPRMRTEFFAAATWQSSLYSVANHALMRTALSGTEPEKSFAIDVGLYDQGSLLVDARGVYGIGTLTNDEQSASVQLVLIGHDGSQQLLLPAGTSFAPVLQFDHDSLAVYVGRDADTAMANGTIERTTSVVRVRKDKTGMTVALPERKLVTSDRTRGGYLGVQVDGQLLYAVFEGAPVDGRMQVELVRQDLSNPAAFPPPQTLLTLPGDKDMRVSLLGVVDGIPLLVRTDTVSTSGAASATLFSVIAVSPRGPRVIADFNGDGPSTGLARDSMRVYWINKKSGGVYAFPRAALL